MPDTFVHFKGIKNDCARDDKQQNFWSHKFVCHHENSAELKKIINQSMNEIFAMGGMIMVKDERKKQDGDFNNLAFIPMHMIARIEIETKEMTTPYITDVPGATKQ